MSTRRAVLAGLASGALLAAATAQIGLGLLVVVALWPLLRAIDRGASPAAAAVAGWVGGVLLFGVAALWVVLAGFRGVLLGVLAVYVGILALGPALFALVLAFLRRHRRALFLCSAPLLWVAIEFVRSQGSLGYPWHHLGYALAPYPALIQLAAIGGVYLVSLWIAGVSAGLVAVSTLDRSRALAAAAVLLLPLLLGVRILLPVGAGPEVDVAVVQPLLIEPARTESSRFRANLHRLLSLSEQAVGEEPVDLLVWPESAYERTLGQKPDLLLGSIAQHYSSPLLTGARREDPGPRPARYNSAVFARRDGATFIASDKVHPFPLYEASAGNALSRMLERRGLWPGRFVRGTQAGLIELRTAPHDSVGVGVLICLDSSYPELARDLRRRGARLLVEISNEAQTGSWTGRQHALVSRMRAVESGLPLVRTSNSGPSEWIDTRGRVVARLPQLHGASGRARLTLPAGPPTPYVRWGHAPVLAAGLLPLVPPLFFRKKENSP